MTEESLTPIEQSRADTGRRYYSIKANFYNGLATSMNAKKNRPTGLGTKAVTMREFPEKDNAPNSADGTRKLISYECRKLTDADFDDIFNTDHPNILELTREEWYALKPVEQ